MTIPYSGEVIGGRECTGSVCELALHHDTEAKDAVWRARGQSWKTPLTDAERRRMFSLGPTRDREVWTFDIHMTLLAALYAAVIPWAILVGLAVIW